LKSLYIRIWLTLVLVLALFALGSGWLLQRHLAQQGERQDASQNERLAAWAELLERSLPPASAPRDEQAMALRDWGQRLRLPIALDDAQGQRIAASEPWQRREAERPWLTQRMAASVRFDDGRRLWVLRMRPPGPRPPGAGPGGPGGPGAAGAPPPEPPWPMLPAALRQWPDGVGLVLLLALLFVGVAAGAWPVVRRLTRRLEALQAGVETFGRGALHHRVAEDGRDEVARVAASFNQAAGRIEALVRSHQSLLANASHELRSPLARLKMAISLLADSPPAEPAARERLQREIDTNIAELDALVEEVLLASRLDAAATQAGAAPAPREPVSLLALAVEEAAHVGAEVEAAGHDADFTMPGDERLLRRALRNLLENARRYGGGSTPTVELVRSAALGPTTIELRVCDRGPGVPEAWRERIFEPFFRLPGHAEQAGGVGLGLSLVRQIAQAHGGRVECRERAGGGSCFALVLATPTSG
jgi:signal transduction histidine kinase